MPTTTPPTSPFSQALLDFIDEPRLSFIAPDLAQDAVIAVIEGLDPKRSRFHADLWRLSLRGDKAQRLTRGPTRDTHPKVLPDGTILFLSARPTPGAPRNAKTYRQIWALPPQGDAYPLSDAPLGVSDFKVSGDRLAYLAPWNPEYSEDTQREKTEARQTSGSSILRYDAQPVRLWDRWLGPEAPHLFAGTLLHDLETDTLSLDTVQHLSPGAGRALDEASWDLSPDGRHLVTTWAVLQKHDRIFDRPLALFDLDTGAHTLQTPPPGTVHTAPLFSPDGRAILTQRYHRSDRAYAHRELVRYLLTLPLPTPETTPPCPFGEAQVMTEGWEAWPAPWGFAGDCVLVTAEEAGRSTLSAIDLEPPFAREPISADPLSIEMAVAVHDQLAAIASDFQTPPSLLSIGRDGSRERLPFPGQSPPATDLHIESHWLPLESDTDESPGALHTHIVTPTGPCERTVVWIHGGPVSSWVNRWHWRWNAALMARAGYRVVMPNPAGSTGYGMPWVNAIWGNVWGDRCHDDIMQLIDHLETRDGLRSEDIAIMGGSFGGYMTNWIGVHGPRFRALVTHASLYHMSSFSGTTDFPAWWHLMMEGTPWENAEADLYSPSTRISRWESPTLILHGEKDYRVPLGQSLALFEALQARDIWSELVVFPDENHWILKPQNSLTWYQQVFDFLDRTWSQ